MAAVKVGSEFEQAMANIAAVTGGTTAEIDIMAEASREMAKDFGLSATQIAKSFQFIAEAGGDADEMINDMRGALLLATASGEDFNMATAFMASTLKTFGDDATDSTHIANVLAATISAANTTVGELDYAFQQVGPTAGMIGANIDDLSIALALMAENGITGGKAGTSLNRMLLDMISPTDKSAAAMEELGLSVLDANNEFKPLSQIMDEVRETFGDMDEAQKAQYTTTIFNTASLSALNAVLSATDEDMEWLTETIYGSQDAFDGLGQSAGMAAVQQDTLQGSLNKLRANLADIGISFYQEFQEPIKSAVNGAIGALRFLSDNFDTVTKIVSAVTVAVGAFVVVMNIAPLLNMVSKAFTAFNAVIAANPLAVVTALVLGLATAFGGLDVILKPVNSAINLVKDNLHIFIPILSAVTAGFIAFKAAAAIQAILTGINTAMIAMTASTGAASLAMGALTVAKGLATAAMLALNAAWLANPIGLIVAGVAALTAGIVAFVAWTSKATEEQKELKKSTEELHESNNKLNESIEASQEAYRNKIQSIEDEIAVSSKLYGEIEKLSQKENKTVEDKHRLALEVDRLNDAMGETVLRYDMENDKLIEVQGNIKDLIAARQEEAKTAAMQERLKELAKEQIDIERQRKAAMELRFKTEEQIADGTLKNNKKTKESYAEVVKSGQELNAQWLENEKAMEELSASIVENTIRQSEAARNSADEQIDAMNDVERNMREVNYQHELLIEAQMAAEKEYTDLLTAEAVERGLTLDQYKELLKEQEQYIESYTKTATDMFKQLSDETEVTVADMVKNLEHNQRVLEEWSDNIAKLAERGIDDGLLEQMRRMGPEGAGYVKAMTTASESEFQQLSELFGKGGESAVEAMSKVFGLPETVNLGSDMVDDIADGVERNKNLTNASENLIVDARNMIDEQIRLSNFLETGKNIVDGMVRGLDSASSSLYTAIQNMMRRAKDVAQKEIDAHSPSRVFRDQIGKTIPQGMAIGIAENSHLVGEAARNMSKMTYDEAVLWIKDYRNSADYMAVEEAAMWDEVAKNHGRMTKERIAAETEARKIREKLLKDEEKANSDAAKEQERAWKEFYDSSKLMIQDYRNDVEYSISEEIKMWEALGEHYTEVSKEKIEIDKTVAKLREDLRKEELEAEKAAREESFNFSKTWIEAQKELNLLTTQEEIEAWQRVADRYEEGTKQREEADKNLSKAREEVRKAEMDAIKEMEDLEAKYTDAVEKRAAAIFNTFGLFSEVNLQETNVEKNTKKVQESQTAYNKAMEELRKVNEAMTEAGITSEKYRELQIKQIDAQKNVEEAHRNLTTATETASKSQAQIMAENLEDQISNLENWEKNLTELAKKGIDEGLLEELRKMGPSAVSYLEALNESTDEELTKLSDNYQKKHELARNLAVAELETLRIETDEKITELLADLTEKMSSDENPIGDIMVLTWIESIRDMTPELKDTMHTIMYDAIKKAEDTNKIRAGKSDVYEELGETLVESEIEGIDKKKSFLVTALEKLQEAGLLASREAVDSASPSKEYIAIGESITDGLIEGIESGRSGVLNSIQSIMQQAIQTAQAALQISSPSRVFMRIGGDTGQGFIEGLKEISSKVSTAVEDTFSGFDVDSINADISARTSRPVLAGAMAGQAGSQRPVQFTYHQNFYVASHLDVKRISREINDNTQKDARAKGVKQF